MLNVVTISRVFISFIELMIGVYIVASHALHGTHSILVHEKVFRKKQTNEKEFISTIAACALLL